MPGRSFSVIICAYTEDRWEHICAAVESVRKQSLPALETILVVDHNSGLYKRLVAEMPDVVVVENSEARGLSGARNTGIALAKGEIIAFLDDDAVADADWLKFFDQVFDDTAVVGVGGLTLPNWQTARPRWLPREFDWVIGCNYLGMPGPGTPVRNLLGGNMSYRREVFDLVEGGFRSGIGRTAGKSRPLGCEETEFCIRLHQRSPEAVLVMEHGSKIWHYIPDARCRVSYLVSRCYAEGLSKAQVSASVGSGDGLSAERGYVTRALPLGVARGIADLLRGDVSGLSRAGAIVLGLGVTVAGFAVGSLRSRSRLDRADQAGGP